VPCDLARPLGASANREAAHHRAARRREGATAVPRASRASA